MMAAQFKYVTLLIHSRGIKADHWYIHLNDGTRLDGLDAILNHYLERGWELVQLTPAGFSAVVVSLFSSNDVRSLYAVFKRPLTPDGT